RALCRRLLDGFDDRREGVAEDHGTPGAEEVEVAVAVGVEEICALGVGHERRIAAYCAKGPHGRVDASGEESFGTKLQLAGTGEAARHGFKYRLEQFRAVNVALSLKIFRDKD